MRKNLALGILIILFIVLTISGFSSASDWDEAKKATNSILSENTPFYGNLNVIQQLDPNSSENGFGSIMQRIGGWIFLFLFLFLIMLILMGRYFQNNKSPKTAKKYNIKVKSNISKKETDNCPECGHKLIKKFKFCPNCGITLNENKYSINGRSIMVKCTCGADNPENAVFCQECGLPIKNKVTDASDISGLIKNDGETEKDKWPKKLAISLGVWGVLNLFFAWIFGGVLIFFAVLIYASKSYLAIYAFGVIYLLLALYQLLLGAYYVTTFNTMIANGYGLIVLSFINFAVGGYVIYKTQKLSMSK